MAKQGKKYLAARAKITKPLYTITEAVALLKETNPANFDASCEMHMRLNIDPKHADQVVRSTISLPHGTGKKLKVVAIVSDDLVDDCMKAGALEAGSENLIEKIGKGWTDFDVVVAMPTIMSKLGKVAKTLGQKGLMPNPKAGTVSLEPAKVVADIIKGKVEFRNDKEGNLHNIFGKLSFGEAKLEENLQTLFDAIVKAKPSGVKGAYIASMFITTTMGPSIPVEFSTSSKK